MSHFPVKTGNMNQQRDFIQSGASQIQIVSQMKPTPIW